MLKHLYAEGNEINNSKIETVIGLYTRLITLGVLVQISNAFSKVRESFSIFIANLTTITELRSIHKRLKEFEMNIRYKKERMSALIFDIRLTPVQTSPAKPCLWPLFFIAFHGISP